MTPLGSRKKQTEMGGEVDVEALARLGEARKTLRDEIAKVIGVTGVAVRVRLHRARRRIAEACAGARTFDADGVCDDGTA